MTIYYSYNDPKAQVVDGIIANLGNQEILLHSAVVSEKLMELH